MPANTRSAQAAVGAALGEFDGVGVAVAVELGVGVPAEGVPQPAHTTNVTSISAPDQVMGRVAMRIR
jgi:hypothetical protein